MIESLKHIIIFYVNILSCVFNEKITYCLPSLDDNKTNGPNARIDENTKL